MPVDFAVVEATVKLLPEAFFTTTLITLPFLTLTTGCTGVFRGLDMRVVALVRFVTFTVPVTF